MSKDLLQLKNIGHHYETPNSVGKIIETLNDISLNLKQGEILSIVGPSGCGKTTLLRIIAGLIAPCFGQLKWLDSGTQKSRRVGMVFQGDALFPWFTVAENIQYAKICRSPLEATRLLYNATFRRAKRKSQASDILLEELLENTGLTQYSDILPSQLSGGMKKRAELARALYTKPDLLLFDEPFSALDKLTKLKIYEHFENIIRNSNSSVILVTHDWTEALRLSDRIILLSGKPATIGKTIELNKKPYSSLEKQDSTELSLIESEIYAFFKNEK